MVKIWIVPLTNTKDHLFCLSNWDFGDKPLCKYEKTLPELVREGQDFDGIVGGENE